MTKKITVKSHGGEILAQADESKTQHVEGNYPPDALHKEFFKPSENNSHTICSWKGEASYYDIHVDGKVLQDAAWYYPNPKSGKAETLKGFVAFYKNKVNVVS
ncbi:hypothetical protein JCM5350_002242 [Sporobolomyces pararoseus]